MAMDGSIEIGAEVDQGALRLTDALRMCKCRVAVEGGISTFMDRLNDVQSFDVVVIFSDVKNELDRQCVTLLTDKLKKPKILYLSEHDEISELIGLRMGAHDVLHANMSKNVICERIMASHRCYTSNRVQSISVTERNLEVENVSFYLDEERNEFWVRDKKIGFTTTEINLLKALMDKNGAIVSRDELAKALEASRGRSVHERSIDSFIKRIRKKFYEHDQTIEIIKTVYGSGYKIAY